MNNYSKRIIAIIADINCFADNKMCCRTPFNICTAESSIYNSWMLDVYIVRYFNKNIIKIWNGFE